MIIFGVIFVEQNNWVARRATNDPKTIDQIHKEAAAEKEREAMQMQDNHMKMKPRGKDKFTVFISIIIVLLSIYSSRIRFHHISIRRITMTRTFEKVADAWFNDIYRTNVMS